MSESPLDVGLLTPVAVGNDDAVTDAAFLTALVHAEVALVRAYEAVGTAPRGTGDALQAALNEAAPIDAAALAAASVAGGNPVIPLVAQLRERVPADVRAWVHRGATSQDVLDTALAFVARDASDLVSGSLRETVRALEPFARAHRDDVAAARTLTQHAVPTTVGLRAANWLRGVRRAEERVDAATRALPAQLGGAAGTLASFVAVAGAEAAGRLPGAYAEALRLATPESPWHTTRWPITELGDALVQAIDAVGVVAADVATLSRTEIGELREGSGGGSSAMPQKRNPAASVLIRSAAMRAPQLGASLHLAAALAVDERPDGAWHAEWPTLRELLRLALGATAQAATLVRGLRVDADAVARNLAETGGLILAERLSIVLGPVVGAKRVARIVRAAGAGEDLEALVEEALVEAGTSAVDVGPLLDPANYTGLAGDLVDRVAPPHPENEGNVSLPTIALSKPAGPDGAPLLVLGASLGTSSVLWEDALPALAERYRVAVLDMPGHGAAPPTREPFTIGAIADAVARAIEERGEQRVLYAGVSLGGAVGLELLLRHPGLVRAAAILASGAKLGEPQGWRDRAAQVRAQSTSSLIIASAQRWFAPGSIERNPVITGRLLHALQDTDDESYALCCEALADFDVRELLPDIEVPVLAVWGAHDEVTPERSLRLVAEGVRDGRAVGLAEASHLPPADDAVETAAVLLRFFDEITEGRTDAAA
ncbi:alpha/beta fold hydrolase [Microbacterium sp. BK668]|uniref:alpha/beta fold hydrolase n=1 Tax=Microbacterium sp. BK668 TaxID=2512118 RepID=UPI0010EB3878|nr:alpha/beta fold hydrolase [Microbacterium sp. BK668]TDN91257.1 3-carboxy-cis,cis-muconate cycloisomerase/3-oxoadipate enol-lactonase,TIGR02427 [Microbacterium sp. BK668]